MGIDPVTHKLRPSPVLEDVDLKPVVCPTLSHMSQWDRVRMETEARLSQASLSAPRPVPPPAATSEAFMRSWKSQVSESLLHRDLAGLDKTAPPPPASGSLDFGAFLQDWEDRPLHSHDTLEPDCEEMSTPGSESGQMSGELISQEPKSSSAADSSFRFGGYPSFFSQMLSPGSPLQQGKLIPELPKCPAPLPSITNDLSPTSTLSSPFGTTPSDFLLSPSTSNCAVSYGPFGTQIFSPKFWSTHPNPNFMTSPAPAMDAVAPSISTSLPNLGENDLQSELPELLMDLPEDVPALGAHRVDQPSTTSSTGWSPYASCSESKDYWAAMLHLVGGSPLHHHQAHRLPLSAP